MNTDCMKVNDSVLSCPCNYFYRTYKEIKVILNWILSILPRHTNTIYKMFYDLINVPSFVQQR